MDTSETFSLSSEIETHSFYSQRGRTSHGSRTQRSSSAKEYVRKDPRTTAKFSTNGGAQ